MNHVTYDFTQHFMTCGRWKKVFDGIARQIASIVECDHIVADQTGVIHYGVFLRKFPGCQIVSSINFISDTHQFMCGFLSDQPKLDESFISALCTVFCEHFPVEPHCSTETAIIGKEDLCFCMKFLVESGAVFLMVPCRPFKSWNDILEVFSYTSNCKADLSKDRLNARHIDMHIPKMEIKAYIEKSLRLADLKPGNVIVTQHSLDHPIHIGVNGTKSFTAKIGHNGEHRCFALHKENHHD